MWADSIYTCISFCLSLLFYANHSIPPSLSLSVCVCLIRNDDFKNGKSFSRTLHPNHSRFLVNRYAKAVDFQKLRDEGCTVIDCVFLHENRLLAVFAKRARGLMARHIFCKPKSIYFFFQICYLENLWAYIYRIVR